MRFPRRVQSTLLGKTNYNAHTLSLRGAGFARDVGVFLYVILSVANRRQVESRKSFALFAETRRRKTEGQESGWGRQGSGNNLAQILRYTLFRSE